MSYKYVIVGAGFYGATIAERIANDLDEPVLVLDKRPHIGGNSYSAVDSQTGIIYHEYGTHIFHTSNKDVWNYINRFTDFNSYYHQVLTTYKNRVYQMPINLETINSFYDKNLKPYEVQSFLENEIAKESITAPQNFEEKAISMIGRPLYDALIKGYTEKQWHKSPKELPESILNRLPFRTNYNESYFFSKWQGIPDNGYTPIFEKMLSSPNITLKLNSDYFDMKDEIDDNAITIYSGPIDLYFEHKYGKLEWRSLKFETERVDVQDYQGTSVMNYAEFEIPFTRIHEPKHLHIDKDYFNTPQTLVIKEYSTISKSDSPYYPVHTENNIRILNKYLEEAEKEKNTIFGGRLGTYKYLDMDTTIDSALTTYNYIKSNYNA